MSKRDPRVVSVVVSGSIPFATEKFLSRLEPIERDLLEELHFRPEEYRNASMFLNIGTNDYNAPPGGVRNFYRIFTPSVLR